MLAGIGVCAMRYRVMRVIVFFDLPMKTANERKIYAEFRKNLIREGFLMIQESVYVRVATTRESAHFYLKTVLVYSVFSWVDD